MANVLKAEKQNNLGAFLHEQAFAAEGAERARLLREAVQEYRATLEVYTREARPQEWARIKNNNLGFALRDLAREAKGAEREQRLRLLREAVKEMRASLSCYTAEVSPEDFARLTNSIAEVEKTIRRVSRMEKRDN